MKLPSRLAIALGLLVTGALTVSQEVSLAHPVHVAIGIICAVVLFLIHPQEAGVVPVAIPETARVPDGATPAPTVAPPGI